MSLSHQERRLRSEDRRDGAGGIGRGAGVACKRSAHLALPRTFPRHHTDPDQSGGFPGEKDSISYTKRANAIRAEIRNLERLGPLPTDDDDYPEIDQKLLDFELRLAAIDPPMADIK